MSQTLCFSLKTLALKVITRNDGDPISHTYYAAFDTPQEAWAALATRFPTSEVSIEKEITFETFSRMFKRPPAAGDIGPAD